MQKVVLNAQASTSAAIALHFRRRFLTGATGPGRQKRGVPRPEVGRCVGVAMQHQLSTSTTISPVKPSPIGNRASARVARFAETEAPCAMQFKKALDFSNAKPKARERVRLVETALRAAAQRSAPQASSGARCSDRQHSAISPPNSSVDGKSFRKSRIVAITSFAVALPNSSGWLFG